MKTKPYGLLGYWKDGNTHVVVNPDPPTAAEARPFHVVIRSKGVIPVSWLVFARDAEHAQLRVEEGLKTCAQLDRSSCRDHAARRILAELALGDFKLTVEPIDVAGPICAMVNWASNGGL